MRSIPAATQINISLSILEDKCDSFVLTPYAQSEALPGPMEQYEFNFVIYFNLDRLTQQAKVSCIVTLLEKQDDSSGRELAELKSSHVFFVQNLHEVIRLASNGTLLIPDPLMEICNSISISSVRGMYSIRKENTVFQNSVLPLLDSKSLIPVTQSPIQVPSNR